MQIQNLDLEKIRFGPSEAMAIWGITPVQFNSMRYVGNINVSKKRAGTRSFSEFNVMQLFQLGIQRDLARDFGFSPSLAMKLAAEVSIDIEAFWQRPGIGNERSEPKAYAIVPGDPPRWYQIDPDQTMASVDEMVGSSQWLVYDPVASMGKVCEALIAKTGSRAAYNDWLAKQKVKGKF